MHKQRWYQSRLANYFTTKFKQYEDVAEFYPDPEDNQWMFYIPELDITFRLTCHDNGVITEEEFKPGGSRL